MAERQLDTLNRAPAEQAAGGLAVCNGSRHRIEQVLAGRPYHNVAALLLASDRPTRSPDWVEVRHERSEYAEGTEQLAPITRLRLEKLLAQ